MPTTSELHVAMDNVTRFGPGKGDFDAWDIGSMATVCRAYIAELDPTPITAEAVAAIDWPDGLILKNTAIGWKVICDFPTLRTYVRTLGELRTILRLARIEVPHAN